MPNSKKLLIRLSSAGDVILTSPLLSLMKRNEPNSEIHFVVKSSYADLVRFNPNVSVVHLVQDHADMHQLESLRRILQGERFELTLDLHNNFRSVYLRRKSAAEIRVINKDIARRELLVKTKLNLFSSVRPAALKYVQTYDRSAAEIPKPEIFVPAETDEKVGSVWKSQGGGNDEAIFLCPGAKHFTKRWPVEYWSILASKLSQFGTVALAGSHDDAEACAKIGAVSGTLDFSGRLSLIESVSLLRHASVVVTNDSFLMHAANALGKRIVAIFGSSVREFGFFPYGVQSKIMELDGLACRPCSHVGRDSCPKRHFKCMLDTPPEAVLNAVTSLMRAN